MARVEGWVEPLEAGDTRPAQPGDAIGDRLHAAAELSDQALGLALSAKGDAHPAEIFEHALKACCVQRDDLGCVFECRRDLVERHRTHRAERLSEDQIGSRVAKRLLVEVEGALTMRAGLAHKGVVFACDRMFRDRWSCQLGQRPYCWWVVVSVVACD